ncbi:hypothetical protein [Candidatus Enterococcus murrayae]|uniref:DUF5067 domain-containing protein n=1 Tax=Candidatus Enterococcus murrayae TaxID=2815321 RepID=A0ABS3HF25_9ENTE|nr:hypothetical protein [Enterococcus sp. MJM16]MBO0452067.1 hypothetical protein [Enterococcus sp. MJM16]
MKQKTGIMSVFVIVLIMLSGCFGDSSATTSSSLKKEVSTLKTENSSLKKELSSLNSGENQTQTTEDVRFSQEVKVFSENETIEFGDGEKKLAEMKVVQATTKQSAFPKRMIELENYDTEKMLAVKIEYKNIDMDTPFFPYAQSFQAFSKDGNRLTAVNQQRGQDEVPKGKKGITQIFWKLPIGGDKFDKVEIDFVSGEQRVATFDLKVSH